jgi:glycosyltransferase involved in cell wall biosynthesis
MRVLWLRPGPCLPLHHGGRVYSYHLITSMADLCHLHVLEAGGDKDETLDGPGTPYGHVIERIRSDNRMPEWSPRRFFTYLWPIVRNLFASREPLCLTLFVEKRFAQRARELVQSRRFDVVVADGIYLASIFEDWESERHIPAVLIQHTVESVLWRRVAEVQRNPVTWLFYHEMARRLRRREPGLCRLFDGVTAISQVDAEHMRRVYGLTNVLGVVPIGASSIPEGVPESVIKLPSSPIVTFVGSMNYQPNADAAFWFIREVLPLIRQTLPDVKFRVIGRDPPRSLVQEAKVNPALEVTGTVEEVLPLLRECSTMVVPLRAGSGVRLKIMESLSAGLPIVSTSVGAEGLVLENGRDILLADDAASFAQAVLRLLQDDALRREMAERGMQRVQSDFSWKQSGARLFEMLASVLQARAQSQN